MGLWVWTPTEIAHVAARSAENFLIAPQACRRRRRPRNLDFPRSLAEQILLNFLHRLCSLRRRGYDVHSPGSSASADFFVIAHADDAGAVGARKKIDCHAAARSAESKY